MNNSKEVAFYENVRHFMETIKIKLPFNWLAFTYIQSAYIALLHQDRSAFYQVKFGCRCQRT